MKTIDVVNRSSYEAKVFLPFYPVLGVFVPFFLVRWRFLSILTHAGAGGGEKGADTEAASFLFSDLSSSSILDCGGDLVRRTDAEKPTAATATTTCSSSSSSSVVAAVADLGGHKGGGTPSYAPGNLRTHAVHR